MRGKAVSNELFRVPAFGVFWREKRRKGNTFNFPFQQRKTVMEMHVIK